MIPDQEELSGWLTRCRISTFLLALLMLPTLQQSGQRHNNTPTLTIVASEVQAITPVKQHCIYLGRVTLAANQ